jgi:hypothetical protein
MEVQKKQDQHKGMPTSHHIGMEKTTKSSFAKLFAGGTVAKTKREKC